MAKLYEIDEAITECIDFETGEIIDFEKLTALKIEREKKIESIALWYKNLMSDAAQYKAEKDLFAKREKVAKNKAESIKQYLDKVLAGTPYKTTRVDVRYRASEAVVVEAGALLDKVFLKYAEPLADKDAIKKAIKNGEQVNGAYIESRNNISIK